MCDLLGNVGQLLIPFASFCEYDPFFARTRRSFYEYDPFFARTRRMYLQFKSHAANAIIKSSTFIQGQRYLDYIYMGLSDFVSVTLTSITTSWKHLKKKNELEFCSSRLTRSLYSQNIRCGSPLVEVGSDLKLLLTWAYQLLHIWFFVISQLEQICKWGIKYEHLVTTDHVGSTCAHHYPHTKFHQRSPYRIWISDFFVSQKRNRYANEVLNMCIRWRQTTWVVLVPPLPTYQVWQKSVIAFS